MAKFYPLIFLLQALCFYHAYKNKKEGYWYFLIFIFPFIACPIYIIKFVRFDNDIGDISENVKDALLTNRKIEKLEKQVQFTDTFQNRMALAEEYEHIENFEKSIELYEASLVGLYQDDPFLLSKLVKNHYLLRQYDKVVEYGEKAENDPVFKKSEERIAYAWSLFHTKHVEKAEAQFKGMDIRFSNYKHRIQFSMFLDTLSRKKEAKELLIELKEEMASMNPQERRLYKKEASHIDDLLGGYKA